MGVILMLCLAIQHFAVRSQQSSECQLKQVIPDVLQEGLVNVCRQQAGSYRVL